MKLTPTAVDARGQEKLQYISEDSCINISLKCEKIVVVLDSL